MQLPMVDREAFTLHGLQPKGRSTDTPVHGMSLLKIELMHLDTSLNTRFEQVQRVM
jgi:hypothetical protein